MLGKQLQNPNILPHTGSGSVPLFKSLAKFLEHRRQRPLAIDIGMIQSCRPPTQRDQIVQWIEHLIAVFIAAGMPGHHGVLMHDLHAIDIAFDRHRLEGTVPRHAITDRVETS